MNQTMNQAIVKNFFDNWSIYDKVLAHNYMYHGDIYRDVQHFITSHYADRPFALFDLGCGSALHLAHALKNSPICRYRGYDLSDLALAQAARNLAGLGCPIELHQGDLLEGLRASREKFDLIFSSFALHHLVSTDKTAFFQLAYSCLNENGRLLLIDVMREEDEGQALYLARYCGWLRSAWKALQPEELDAICEHIGNHDFPETASTLAAMAADAGFDRGIEINRFRWHHTFCFKKGFE